MAGEGGIILAERIDLFDPEEDLASNYREVGTFLEADVDSISRAFWVHLSRS